MQKSLFDIKTIAAGSPIKTKVRAAAQNIKNGKSVGILNKRLQRCQETIGPLEMGSSVHYASCGEWSNHDLISHIIDQVGPAHLIFSTWSVSENAVRILLDFLKQGKFLSMRGLFDWRVKVRRPEVLELIKFNLVKTDMYLSNCHAKVSVLKNDQWGISIVGSANFTNNPRIEAGVISCDHTAANFHHKWISAEIDRGKPFEEEK